MAFLLETTRFIELRVFEECLKEKKYTPEYISQAVEYWANVVGISEKKDWKNILLPQLKKELFNKLQEGAYFYAAL